MPNVSNSFLTQEKGNLKWVYVWALEFSPYCFFYNQTQCCMHTTSNVWYTTTKADCIYRRWAFWLAFLTSDRICRTVLARCPLQSRSRLWVLFTLSWIDFYPFYRNNYKFILVFIQLGEICCFVTMERCCFVAVKALIFDFRAIKQLLYAYSSENGRPFYKMLLGLQFYILNKQAWFNWWFCIKQIGNYVYFLKCFCK